MNYSHEDEGEDNELTHIYHQEIIEDIQHTKTILGCYDRDILNPEDISYVEWFDDYEKCSMFYIIYYIYFVSFFRNLIFTLFL